MRRDLTTVNMFADQGVELPDPLTERDQDRARKRAKRAEERDLTIPPCRDPERRERCKDPIEFLKTYFPHHFYLQMSRDQKETVAVTVQVMLYGGNQAMARPRGTGKTTTQEFLSLWAVLYGVLDLLLYVAASKPEADARLEELRLECMQNELLLEDFPEFMYPIHELDGNAQRAKGQTVGGELTHVSWTGDRIVFPAIQGTAATGQAIITRGIESGIRGVKHRGRRPQFVLIDDPQTRESAYSNTQCTARLDIVERDIGGAGDNRAKMACVALVTIITEGDVADQLTDREKYPAWQGIRSQLMKTKPERMDLWDRYVEMYRDDQMRGDRFARKAHAFYLAHQAEMDRGAVVAWDELYFGRHTTYAGIDQDDAETGNRHRADIIEAVARSGLNKFLADDKFRELDPETASSLTEANILPDGTEIEVSALQHCFNIIAEKGQMVFDSEYQNEPTDAQGDADKLTPAKVCDKINNQKRGAIPSQADKLVAYIDVHKSPLYYVVMALEPSYPGYVIDYGTWPKRVDLQTATKASSLEGSIYAGLDELGKLLLDRVWIRDDGLEMKIDRCLVDSRWGDTTQTVYDWCRMSKWSGVVRPAAGVFIRATGTPITKKARPNRRAREVVGDNWKIAPAPKDPKIRLVTIDANHWKSFAHNRLRTAIGEKGCVSIFGKEPSAHRVFAQHITAERAEKVTSKSRGETEEWHSISGRDNHYLDCLAGCMVAASVEGIRYTPVEQPEEKPKKRKRRSLSQIQASRRR